jgi:hypothetical protein
MVPAGELRRLLLCYSDRLASPRLAALARRLLSFFLASWLRSLTIAIAIAIAIAIISSSPMTSSHPHPHPHPHRD